MSPNLQRPLGILGGTFDPLHNAHLRFAVEAREALGLAGVTLIPAGAPRLRDVPQVTVAHRVAMVRCAIAGETGLELDTGEADSDQPSYTVATLERLRATAGTGCPLVLLVGADAFARFEAWHRWRDLFGLAHIAVATRPGHALKVGAGNTALDAEICVRQGSTADLAAAPAGRIVAFAITPLEISATDIRRRIAAGLSVRHLVPDPVVDYIQTHQLYRTPHGH